jgi:hypothetical protein
VAQEFESMATLPVIDIEAQLRRNTEAVEQVQQVQQRMLHSMESMQRSLKRMERAQHQTNVAMLKI